MILRCTFRISPIGFCFFFFFYFQVEAIKKIAEYVAQLRRVGKGHGGDLLCVILEKKIYRVLRIIKSVFLMLYYELSFRSLAF